MKKTIAKQNWEKNYKKRKIYLQRKRRHKIREVYGISERCIRYLGLKLALFVYDRADRKCEKCGAEYDLTIHHKDRNGVNNEEKKIPMNNTPSNLQVLCRSCHGFIHGKQSGEVRRKKGG